MNDKCIIAKNGCKCNRLLKKTEARMPPLFGVSQMGEVAERSEVGGGLCLESPPQSLRDSSPIPYGTGEPFLFGQSFTYWMATHWGPPWVMKAGDRGTIS